MGATLSPFSLYKYNIFFSNLQNFLQLFFIFFIFFFDGADRTEQVQALNFWEFKDWTSRAGQWVQKLNKKSSKIEFWRVPQFLPILWRFVGLVALCRWSVRWCNRLGLSAKGVQGLAVEQSQKAVVRPKKIFLRKICPRQPKSDITRWLAMTYPRKSDMLGMACK